MIRAVQRWGSRQTWWSSTAHVPFIYMINL
jgi:hypothetical protein